MSTRVLGSNELLSGADADEQLLAAVTELLYAHNITTVEQINEISHVISSAGFPRRSAARRQ